MQKRSWWVGVGSVLFIACGVACGADAPPETSTPELASTVENDAGAVPVAVSCAPGEYASGARCAPWSTCAVGSYIATEGTATSNRVCEACAPNAHADRENAAACTPNGPCVAGTASPLANGVCAACEPGTYCAGGTSAKVGCADGADDSWDDDGASATPCKPKQHCPLGQSVVSNGSGSADRTCAPCVTGTFSATRDAAACTPWTDCVAGTAVATGGTDVADRTCKGCISGTFTAGSNAVACAAWQSCAAGSFVSTAGSSTGDRACTTCAPGTFADDVNLSACLPADQCAAGTVQTGAATTTAPAQCATCARGTHCAGGTAPKVDCGDTTWDGDGKSSTACVAKTECVAGSFVTSDGTATTDRTCATCATGFTTTSNAAACTAFTTCTGGSYIGTIGTKLTDRKCTVCGAGTFSNAVNVGACTPYTTCALGTYVRDAGNTTTDRACTLCPGGQTTFQTNATTCVASTAPPTQGPTGCLAVARVDRTIATKATDQYEWYDSTCAKRTASLVRSDNKGGHAIEMSYLVGAGRRVVGMTPNTGDSPYPDKTHYEIGGFGYVVSHLENGSIAYDHGEDDSPLGSSLANTYQALFVGKHHAIHEFTINYPRWSRVNGKDVKYAMPVTVHWAFRTGLDAIVYAITFDLSAAPAGAVSADMRAPYGELQIDGTAVGSWANDPVGNIAWADSRKFRSLATTGLTLGSAWTWSEVNTGPAYNAMWLKTIDAEMGSVATDVIARADAGGYSNGQTSSRGSTSALGTRCASDDQYGDKTHVMPCVTDWAFQSINYEFDTLKATTTGRRLAWGSDWGTLGKASVTTVNGTTVTGHPRVSYSVLVALDVHSKAPVTTMAAQIEVAHGTKLTATTGSVRTSGPAGAGRTDTMAYAPAGYSPVYGTWELDAAANAAALGIDVSGGSALTEPTLVVHGWTGTTLQVVLDGTTLVADSGYFASTRSGELWLTLHQGLKGSGHTVAISAP